MNKPYSFFYKLAILRFSSLVSVDGIKFQISLDINNEEANKINNLAKKLREFDVNSYLKDHNLPNNLETYETFTFTSNQSSTNTGSSNASSLYRDSSNKSNMFSNEPLATPPLSTKNQTVPGPEIPCTPAISTTSDSHLTLNTVSESFLGLHQQQQMRVSENPNGLEQHHFRYTTHQQPTRNHAQPRIQAPKITPEQIIEQQKKMAKTREFEATHRAGIEAKALEERKRAAEARRKAEAEAKALEERKRAAEAEAEARRKAEAEAKALEERKRAAEARRKAEAEAKALEERKRAAEAEVEARRKAETETINKAGSAESNIENQLKVQEELDKAKLVMPRARERKDNPYSTKDNVQSSVTIVDNSTASSLTSGTTSNFKPIVASSSYSAVRADQIPFISDGEIVKQAINNKDSPVASLSKAFPNKRNQQQVRNDDKSNVAGLVSENRTMAVNAAQHTDQGIGSEQNEELRPAYSTKKTVDTNQSTSTIKLPVTVNGQPGTIIKPDQKMVSLHTENSSTIPQVKVSSNPIKPTKSSL
ncbi:hypothetical protein JL09_g5194, partial [Pichia kudriavzevii]